MIEQVTRKVLSFADGVSSFSADLGASDTFMPGAALF